jgi:GxxExxY protein
MPDFRRTMDFNALTEKIIGLAIHLHRTLGPGLLESAFEKPLLFECQRNGLDAKSQVLIPIVYEGLEIDQAFRADVIIEDQVILELKSVKDLDDHAYKQLLTYLRLSGRKRGLIINFNEVLLKNGIKRVINGELDSSPLCDLCERHVF